LAAEDLRRIEMAKSKGAGKSPAELWADIDSGADVQTGQRGFYRPLPIEKSGPYQDHIVKFPCVVLLSGQQLQKRKPIPGVPNSSSLVDLIGIFGPNGYFVKEAHRHSGNEPGTWNSIQAEDVR